MSLRVHLRYRDHTHKRFVHTGEYQCMWGNWTVGTGQSFHLSKIQIPWGFYLCWCLRGHLCMCGKTAMTSSSFLHSIQYSIYLIIQCTLIINDSLGGIFYLHTKLNVLYTYFPEKRRLQKGTILYSSRYGNCTHHFPIMAIQCSIEYLTEMIKLYHTQQFMQKVKSKDTSRMKLHNFD